MQYLKLNISKLLSFALFAFSGLLLYGCSTSSTAITGTWTSEGNQSAEYEQIVVAPLIADGRIKANVEDELAKSLEMHNVEAKKGSIFLPQDYTNATTNDKEAVLETVKTDGVDAILTVSIIDKETEARYVPSSTNYAPYPAHPYYGSFWGYYDYWYPRVYEPGYYETDHFYYLETNLFDAETEELIWSAQTETYDPITIESFTDDFSRKIATQLKEDGII